MLRLQCETMRMVNGELFKNNSHLFTAADLDKKYHYTLLLMLLLKQYFPIRIRHMCRTDSCKAQGLSIRQLYTKLILFKGQ